MGFSTKDKKEIANALRSGKTNITTSSYKPTEQGNQQNGAAPSVPQSGSAPKKGFSATDKKYIAEALAKGQTSINLPGYKPYEAPAAPAVPTNPLSDTVLSLSNQRDTIKESPSYKIGDPRAIQAFNSVQNQLVNELMPKDKIFNPATGTYEETGTGHFLQPIGETAQLRTADVLSSLAPGQEKAVERGADRKLAEIKQVQVERGEADKQDLASLQEQRKTVNDQLSDLEMSLATATEPAQRVAIQSQIDKLLDQSDALDEQIANKQQDIVTNDTVRTVADVSKEASDANKRRRAGFWNALGNAYAASAQGEAGRDAMVQAGEDAAEWRQAKAEEQKLNEELKETRGDYRLTQEQRDQYKARLEELAPQMQIMDTSNMTPEEYRQWSSDVDEYQRLATALQNDSLSGSETLNRVAPNVGNRLAQAGAWTAGFLSTPAAQATYLTPEQTAEVLDSPLKDPLYEASFGFGERAAEIAEEATRNKTSEEKLAYSAMQNVTEMAADALVNTLTGGGGLMFMGFRVFGSEASNAMSQGASEAQALLYGAAKAGVEVATEKMFDGLYGVYGAGVADDMTKDIIYHMTENPTIAKLLTIGFAGAGESLEEFTSGMVDPLIDSIVSGEVKYDADWWNETGDAMLISSIIGSLGGTAQVVGNHVQTANGTDVEIGSPEWRNAIASREVLNKFNEQGISDEEVYNAIAEEQTRELANNILKTAGIDANVDITTNETAATETPETATETNPAVDSLLDSLNRRNDEGNVTNAATKAILADQTLVDLFNENVPAEAQITAENNAKNRQAIRDNADAVAAALVGETTETTAPTTEAPVPTTAPTIEAESSVAPQQTETAQAEGINTPTEVETAETPVTQQNINEETAPEAASAEQNALTPQNNVPTEQAFEGTVEEETPQLPGKMKRSQTESNTEQSVAGKLGGQQNPLYYEVSTEEQTLRAAAGRVRQDIGGEMTNLMGKEMWTNEDMDTGLTIYGILMADALRTRDYSAVQAWGKVVQTRGTATAKSLQALAKWSRGTGQGVASNAVMDMADATNIPEEQKNIVLNDIQKFGDRYDSLVQKDGTVDVDGLRDLILDLNKYRKTGTFDPKKFGKILKQVQDTEWLQEFALRQLMAVPADYTNKASLAQQLKTWQVNSQLSRLGTFFRNIGGNMAFGVQDTLAQNAFGRAIDALVAKKTGHREVAGDKGWASAEARKAGRDALLKSILEVSGDVDMTGDVTRNGISTNRTNKMTGNGFEQFMSRWEQLLGYSLTSSDRFSRGQIEASIVEGLMKANGNNMTEEQARAIAKQVADYRLFQNNGRAAQFSRSVHDALNKIGIKGPNGESFGLGDLINPYPGVPANLGVKALEYSPANIIKGGLELHKILSDYKNGVEVEYGRQTQAVMDMARGMSGVPAIALLALLFKKGVIKNADDEDDLDAKAQASAEGRTGVQINLSAMKRALQGEKDGWQDGDDLMSIGWLEPLNAFMAISSMVADSAEDESFWSMAKQYPKAYLTGALQSILDMPVMSNLANMVDAYNYSSAEDLGGKLGDMALQGAGDAISGMIPAPVGQFAKATDPMQRSTKGDSNFETVVNGLMSNIPGLREQLNPKLDSYGNEREYSGTDAQRWLNTFVLPGAISEYNQNDIQKLTDDLYNATGDANVFPDRKPPSSLRFGTESVKLDTEQQDAYQRKAGETIQSLVERATHTATWNNLSDEEKVSALDSVYKYAEYQAKKEFAEANGYEMPDNAYSKYEKLDDPVEGIIWNDKWSAATANGKQDYVAMDKVISEMDHMSDDVKEMMENKDYVQKLEDAAALGIGSRDFFITHDFLSGIAKAEKEGTPLDYAAIDKGLQQYMGVVDSEDKADIFSGYFGKGDELAEAAKSGMKSEEWFKYYHKYKEISDLDTDDNGEKISTTDKYNRFGVFVDSSDLSPEQKEMIKGQLKFFTGFNVSNTSYDKMVRGGTDPELAYKIVQNQNALTPTEDHKTVTSNQKAFSVLDDKSIGDPADRMNVILNTEGSAMKPNQATMAHWLYDNFSYSEAKYYWSQLQKKYGWSKKSSYEKALQK